MKRITWIFACTLLIEVIITLLPTLAFAQASAGGEKASSPIAAGLAALTLLVGLAKAIFEYTNSRNEKAITPSQDRLTLQMINNIVPTVGLDSPKTELLLWFVGSLAFSIYFFVLDAFLLDALLNSINMFGLDKHPSLGALQQGILDVGVDALFWGSIVVLFLLGCAALVYAVEALKSYLLLREIDPDDKSDAAHTADIQVAANKGSAMAKCATVLKALDWYITELDLDEGEINAMKIKTAFYVFSHSGKSDTCTVRIEEKEHSDIETTQDKDVKTREYNDTKCSVITVICDGVGVRPNFESNKKRNRRHVRQFVAQLIG